MDINELTAWLTEGLDDAGKATVVAALNRDSVKTRVAGVKKADEFAALEQQRQALQLELEGVPNDNTKMGAKAYKDWYARNEATIRANAEAIEAFDKKYGKGSFAAQVANLDSTTVTPPAGSGKTYSDEDILKLVDSRFQNDYSGRISNVMKSFGGVMQKHFSGKRTNALDFAAIEGIIQEAAKRGSSLSIEDAYDIWDKPERDKTVKADTDAEVNRRVEEELKRRGAGTHFPAGADMTPGVLASRSKGDVDKFDRSALNRDLANLWNNPEEGQGGSIQ